MAANTSDSYRNYFLNRMKAYGLYCSEEMSNMDIQPEILEKITPDQAARYHILPIQVVDDRLILVTDTDQTFKQRAVLEQELNQKIKLLLCEEENLRMALLKFYDVTNYRQEGSSQKRDVDADMTPLKGAINEMLQDAARQKASDIHMLPALNGFKVSFRIAGHMVDVTHDHFFPASQVENVTNLIKLMDDSRNVDVMRTNMPNEGSFYLHRGSQDIFIRLETLPVGSDGQEKINLRLLPQAGRTQSTKKTLDSIGYIPEDLEAIKSVLYKNATGMFLNSGPTGAGKTTSLHAEIHYVLDSVQEPLNVIEIAEPIEIYEDDFTQVQVRKATNEALNLTAEKILVASLRSDPDIILYNEIRNATDATVAMQASNTGHRVFSTVHAADCTRTISRLLDFDISKTTPLSELKLIISQRLVATLCPYCSKPHNLTEKERRLLTPREMEQVEGRLREKGSAADIQACPHCNHGYSGRTAIAEYVIFNTEIRDALLHQRSFGEIQEVLRKNNFRSMWEKGIDMAMQGKIELDELIHVVGK